jgi:hypothetical protein
MARAAASYRVGDIVFWSLRGSVESEAMFVGQLKEDPAVLVLAIGNDFAEIDADACSPAGGGQSQLGASYRRAYLKQHPGSLK